MTIVEIPDEIASEYAHHARVAGSDMDTFIREALIEKLEDIEDIRIACERLADPQPTLSIEEVMRNLGLDD